MRRLCRREMKLTMKLTMREPAFMGSMTTWPRRVTSNFNSVLWNCTHFTIFTRWRHIRCQATLRNIMNSRAKKAQPSHTEFIIGEIVLLLWKRIQDYCRGCYEYRCLVANFNRLGQGFPTFLKCQSRSKYRICWDFIMIYRPFLSVSHRATYSLSFKRSRKWYFNLGLFWLR